ncbi:hypothetical protein EST38_g10962 [Candolleomyces aberdarensis]|uniref:DNA-directed DNA polymerase X domain-containing protein n=1 Tax=Candolleomyces aberdarensis TaxID=2316362 RepID=A0A4V1Q2F3_9AGAR|nr:hypothetical protein EST38_g10962 [Candolleomyces aberdarensis]
MAPKRRPADSVSSYTSSDSDLEGSNPRRSKKRQRRSRAGAGAAADSSSEDEARPLRVYIVQAKLTPDAINELYQLVEDFASSRPETEAMEMELCSDAKKADIVVTAVHMKPRLERHIDWSIAMIKSYPNVITNGTFEADVSKLPGMGGKIAFKVEEYLETGSIPEAQTTLASERYQALSTFVSIYGIGPAKARQFYDMGMRNISDLQRYHDITPDSQPKTPAEVDALLTQLDDNPDNFTPNGKRIPKSRDKPPDITVPVALALKGELEIPIPRDEVEEIRDVVMRELEDLQPDCVSTIVGGYRRGKPKSNDVDIVISHSDPIRGKDIIPSLCNRLTARLYKKGLVTHVMHLSGFHSYNALRTEHWDTLEKALTVFKLPPKPGVERLHRRLDLIFTLPDTYWTAVIGWTGSKMFQRDLRLWAKKEKGMKFDSVALTRRHDTRRYLPKSEKEVFDILGLPWIDPTMRNADA